MNQSRICCLLPGLILNGLTAVSVAFAQSPPVDLTKQIGFSPTMGAQLPLDVSLQDQSGKQVQLRKYFGKRPVIITPVYYRCPMLCGLELNGLVRGLRGMTLSAGTDFDIVTFSIDPREPSSLARQKREAYLAQYGREGAQAGWQFLVGDQANVSRLCAALGFRTTYDDVSGQYAHAAGIVICTADGRIARYLPGVEFDPHNLRLAVVEASQGEIGTLQDHVQLFCYTYDPTTGKYGLAILAILRMAGVMTFMLLAGSVLAMLAWERRARSQPQQEFAHE